MVKKARHIIIGNSAAALSAIKAIRKSGDKGSILLVSAENHYAYSPVLTTYYIGGAIGRNNLFLTDKNFYKKHAVQTIFKHRAVRLEPEKKHVFLDDRTTLEYGNLLIATGAAARYLNGVEPDAAPFVSSLRTIEDADKIRRLGRNAEEVVVTGAGLVSMQTIKAINRPNLKITAVVGSDQVLSQQLDRESAYLIQKHLQAEGVEILFGRGIESVKRKGDRVEVVTSFGESLPADLVVVGKGVTPNTGLADGSGIQTGWGITVDHRMQTSHENVYAAGDVAEGKNLISGQREVIATWFNACSQGEIAGMNMAGRPAELTGQVRENITTLMGIVVAAIGQSRPEHGQYEEVRYVDFGKKIIRKLFFNETRLAGALLIGRFFDAGVIKHCIANRVDLAEWKSDIAASPLDFAKVLAGQGFQWPTAA